MFGKMKEQFKYGKALQWVGLLLAFWIGYSQMTPSFEDEKKTELTELSDAELEFEDVELDGDDDHGATGFFPAYVHEVFEIVEPTNRFADVTFEDFRLCSCTRAFYILYHQLKIPTH